MLTSANHLLSVVVLDFLHTDNLSAREAGAKNEFCTTRKIAVFSDFINIQSK